MPPFCCATTALAGGAPLSALRTFASWQEQALAGTLRNAFSNRDQK